MSMSNRARRMLQHQLRHRADAELNLIPMIDILSVMVSFLLVYSTNVEVLQNNKAIEIPQSISEHQPRTDRGGHADQGRAVRAGRAGRTVADIQATAWRHHRAAARGAEAPDAGRPGRHRSRIWPSARSPSWGTSPCRTTC